MAPRVLHFGKDELLWECREQNACETYPQGLPQSLEQTLHTNFKSLNPAHYLTKNAKEGIEMDMTTAAYKVWDTIIWAYSKTSLTVSSDKLIALSGIAKHMRSITNDEYVAGMWRSRLKYYLLWARIDVQREGNRSLSSRPTTYRAPTWSWAATDGDVTMTSVTADSHDSDLGFQVRGLKLEYATEDTTGAITGGWLDIAGHLRPMQLHKPNDDAEEDWYMSFNDEIVQLEGFRPSIYLDVPPPNDTAFDVDNAAQRLFCMGEWPSDSNNWLQLLLFRLKDTQEKLFERIGLAFGICPKGQTILFAELDEDVERNLPCQSYKNGLHTIRVI